MAGAVWRAFWSASTKAGSGVEWAEYQLYATDLQSFYMDGTASPTHEETRGDRFAGSGGTCHVKVHQIWSARRTWCYYFCTQKVPP